jgi:hypothetical protein
MLIVAEFRDSTVVAISQCATPFHDIDQDACMAGPVGLEKLPENGKIFSFIISREGMDCVNLCHNHYGTSS